MVWERPGGDRQAVAEVWTPNWLSQARRSWRDEPQAARKDYAQVLAELCNASSRNTAGIFSNAHGAGRTMQGKFAQYSGYIRQGPRCWPDYANANSRNTAGNMSRAGRTMQGKFAQHSRLQLAWGLTRPGLQAWRFVLPRGGLVGRQLAGASAAASGRRLWRAPPLLAKLAPALGAGSEDAMSAGMVS